MSELPIMSGGKLVADAGFLVLGSMCFPKDSRSAQQFAAILFDETQHRKANPSSHDGQLFTELKKQRNFPLMHLVGCIGLRIAKDHLAGLRVSKGRAARVESEIALEAEQATETRLPNSEDRLRKTFTSFESVAHLWAASAVAVRQPDGSRRVGGEALDAILFSRRHLLGFLATAQLLEKILLDALPSTFRPLSVPVQALEGVDLREFHVRLFPDHPWVEAAKVSYKPRSGR